MIDYSLVLTQVAPAPTTTKTRSGKTTSRSLVPGPFEAWERGYTHTAVHMRKTRYGRTAGFHVQVRTRIATLTFILDMDASGDKRALVGAGESDSIVI